MSFKLGHSEGEQQSERVNSTQAAYTPDEQREVVRRAQQIRAEAEGRLTHEQLAESAAEVGIREQDLLAAARQMEAERTARLEQKQRQSRLAAITATTLAAVLVLGTMFTFNGLNGRRAGVLQARANLQSTLQRRADLIPQLATAAREGSASQRDLMARLDRSRQSLASPDLSAQLQASDEIAKIQQEVLRAGGGSRLYESLAAGLEGSENRINVARNRYNAAATEYNRSASGFPAKLFRPLTGMPAEVPLFEASKEALQQPKL